MSHPHIEQNHKAFNVVFLVQDSQCFYSSMQVELIVAVHDLLAEYGRCCAGRDDDGEEGTFLKFAIKHLMALDVKIKSQLSMFLTIFFLVQIIFMLSIPSISLFSPSYCIDLNGMEDVVPENDIAEDRMTDEPVCSSKHNSEDEDEEESGKTGLHGPFLYSETISYLYCCKNDV
jgi:hypothetical protein